MKKLLVWGYALQSMDKVEKMGLPRVSSGVLGISEVFNPKKTHPDFDFPWSWFVKGQEIPPMPEKVYICLKKARGVTFDFLPYNDFFIRFSVTDYDGASALEEYRKNTPVCDADEEVFFLKFGTRMIAGMEMFQTWIQDIMSGKVKFHKES